MVLSLRPDEDFEEIDENDLSSEILISEVIRAQWTDLRSRYKVGQYQFHQTFAKDSEGR